jgi:hypothetical protein
MDVAEWIGQQLVKPAAIALQAGICRFTQELRGRRQHTTLMEDERSHVLQPTPCVAQRRFLSGFLIDSEAALLSHMVITGVLYGFQRVILERRQAFSKLRAHTKPGWLSCRHEG